MTEKNPIKLHVVFSSDITDNIQSMQLCLGGIKIF